MKKVIIRCLSIVAICCVSGHAVPVYPEIQPQPALFFEKYLEDTWRQIEEIKAEIADNKLKADELVKSTIDSLQEKRRSCLEEMENLKKTEGSAIFEEKGKCEEDVKLNSKEKPPHDLTTMKYFELELKSKEIDSKLKAIESQVSNLRNNKELHDQLIALEEQFVQIYSSLFFTGSPVACSEPYTKYFLEIFKLLSNIKSKVIMEKWVFAAYANVVYQLMQKKKTK
jgi:preprotein translocase subunit SecA